MMQIPTNSINFKFLNSNKLYSITQQIILIFNLCETSGGMSNMRENREFLSTKINYFNLHFLVLDHGIYWYLFKVDSDTMRA